MAIPGRSRWSVLAKSRLAIGTTVACMERRTASRRGMAEAATLARIAELAKAGSREDRRGQVTTNGVTATPAAEADRELKAAVRGMWALGDYHKFATELV